MVATLRYVLSAILISFLVVPDQALAYVDPGTTGMIYQVVVLALGAVVGYFAFLRKKIGAFFSKTKKDKDSRNDPNDVDTEN